tara:strand:- start:202 stop:486 length:285 start_codon:yes stop_codon:yes gene_type:complete
MARGPFKMKANHEGPMRKNFPSVFKKTTEPTEGVKNHLKDKTKEELEVIAKRNLENLNKIKNESSLDNIHDQMAIRDTLAGVKGRAIEIIKEGE